MLLSPVKTFSLTILYDNISCEAFLCFLVQEKPDSSSLFHDPYCYVPAECYLVSGERLIFTRRENSGEYSISFRALTKLMSYETYFISV